jgi:hypothetical protein
MLRYDNETLRPHRPLSFTGVPHVKSAEVMFIRQIQKLMFDIYFEHISLLLMNSGIEEVQCFQSNP